MFCLGCNRPCFGYGYNSIGIYSTGWSGNCGEGGKGNAVWYLFCPNCRTAALRYHNNENVGEDDMNQHLKEFKLLTNTQNMTPEIIMHRNAIFLLGLSPTNRSQGPQQKSTKGNNRASWTIDLHPTQQSILSTTTTTNTQNDASIGHESVCLISFKLQKITKNV